jgi:hypothetical protein
MIMVWPEIRPLIDVIWPSKISTLREDPAPESVPRRVNLDSFVLGA